MNFIDHLVATGMLAGNALIGIAPPKEVRPRDRHLATPDAIRLVQAFDDPENETLNALIAKHDLRVDELQGYIALLNGAGVDVSVALVLPARNGRVKAKEVLAPGTKTYNRKRVVRVADWAWPWVEVLTHRPKNQRLFASIRDRWIAADAFNAVISKLAAEEPETFADYWMRDGRHTYAVRAIKGGTPAKVVATQLGHKDSVLVHKVYGVNEPSGSERDYWEKRAAARDREEEGVRVPTRVAAKRPNATASPTSSKRPVHAGHTAKIAWPAIEELLAKLAERSVVAVAKELGVSDQALRKHLKRRGVKQIPDGRRAAGGPARPRGQGRPVDFRERSSADTAGTSDVPVPTVSAHSAPRRVELGVPSGRGLRIGLEARERRPRVLGERSRIPVHDSAQHQQRVPRIVQRPKSRSTSRFETYTSAPEETPGNR